MKNMRRAIVVCCGLLFGGVQMMAQIAMDSTTGLVGKEVALAVFYNGAAPLEEGREIVLKGEFKLSNPTVFFPQVFRDGEQTTILDSELESSTDTTWTFAIRLQVDQPVSSGDLLTHLAGEALAGSDSIVKLFFHDLFLDETPIADATGTIVTRSIGSRIPYVRSATLDPGRPNPTAPGITVTWGFRIDKDSDVTFKIYDMIGQEVDVKNLGMLEQGVYINTFTPDFFFPSGMFFVRLMTNSGEAWQVMHVLR